MDNYWLDNGIYDFFVEINKIVYCVGFSIEDMYMY